MTSHEGHGVSNSRRMDCLFNGSCSLSIKTTKHCTSDLLWGKSNGNHSFASQRVRKAAWRYNQHTFLFVYQFDCMDGLAVDASQCIVRQASRNLTHWDRWLEYMGERHPSGPNSIITHWGWLKYIYIRQRTRSSFVQVMLVGAEPLREAMQLNLSEIWIEIQWFSHMKMHLKMSSAK